MTKKHFIALARELRATMPTFAGDKDNIDYLYYGFQMQQWRDCVLAVARACKEFNPAFNIRTFVEACGVPNLLPE